MAAVMKRYHYNREHYMCDVEHTINIVDVAAIVVDTLASCYDSISRDEMFDKVIENLEAVRREQASEATEADAEAEAEADAEAEDEAVEQDSVAKFIRERCELGKGKKVSSVELFKAYKEWLEEGDRGVSDKWFSSQMKKKGVEKKGSVRFEDSILNGYAGIALKT